jgi:SAM-dependent methyltransferase
MNDRGPWQGMINILRFNRNLYLAAFVVFLAAAIGIVLLDTPLFRIASAAALAGSGYFLFISLGVAHLIYDRSDVYRFGWLRRALGASAVEQAVFCHSGLDEVSEDLRAKLQPAVWHTLDHFDPVRMTEPSIRRARQLYPPAPGTIACPFDRWPVESGSTDVVFGLLAIHEFRTGRERTAWFTEARRCLKPGGRIVLAEHLRDLPNALAFGPGFLHFHSAASWRRCWWAAGFKEVDGFSVTPWIRFFILVPS